MSSPIRLKYQMQPVRGPRRILVAALVVSQLDVLAAGDVHDENIEFAGSVATRPGERHVLAVGMPGGVRRLTAAGRYHLHARAAHIHPVNLLRAGSRYKQNLI